MKRMLPNLRKQLSRIKKLHPALKVGGGLLPVISAIAIVSLVTNSIAPALTTLASGVYTNASTDSDGNTHLAANSVVSSFTYDLATDSDEATQQALGVDPNWYNGVTRKAFAVTYDGSNDFTTLGNGSSVQLSSGTLEAWVRTTDTGSVKAIAIKENAFGIYSDSGILKFYDYNAGVFRSSAVTVNDGLWHHVALVFQSGITGGTKLFFDGELVATDTMTVVNQSSAVTVGSNSAAGQSLAGTVDEVRLSTSLRYTSDFAPSRRLVEDSATAGLWHFDEGSGTSVTDASGNANTGTLTNGPVWVSGAQAITDGFRGCSPDDTNDASCLSGGRTGAGNITIGSNSAITNDRAYEIQTIDTRSGVSFDGTNDFLDAGNAANLQQTTGTLEAWIKTSDTTAAYRTILSKQSAYGLFVHSGKLVTYDWGANVMRDSGVTIADNQWHHVALTYQSGTTNGSALWIDGRRVLTTTVTIALQTFSMRFGANNTPDQYFSGSVDEARFSTSLRYTSDFSPQRRFKADSATAGLWHFDENTGTTANDVSGNSNTGTLTNGPTWTTGLVRTDATQGDPLYYRWRQVGGSWSAAAPLPSTNTQIASTGVFFRGNQGGVYGDQDTFTIASWVTEASSTAGPQRGTRRSFPQRTHLAVSASGVDVIDAATNKLWMRFTAIAGDDYLRVSPVGVAAKNGTFYITKGDAAGSQSPITRVDFVKDAGQFFHSGDCLSINANITRRSNPGGGASGGCTYETSTSLSGNGRNGISTQVINAVQYFAIATTDSVLVYSELSKTYNRYRRTSGDDYSRVLLTSTGTLYAANLTAGGVDMWTNVTADTSDQTGADFSYTTSSTPALRSNTVNALSVTEGTSTAETGQDTLAVGTSLGVDLIQIHSTQASGSVSYYAREGSTGTSGYSQKRFGGALNYDGSNDSVILPGATAGLADFSTTFTVEGWVKGADYSTYRAFFTRQNSGSLVTGTPRLDIGYGGGQLYFTTYESTGGAIDEGRLAFTMNTGQWYHWALSVSGTTKNAYINGVLVYSASVASSWPANTHATRIGGGRSFSGSIDEVRISNTARYTSTFTPSTVPFTTDGSTVALYHFDEQNGQTVTDVSSNANNGTLGATSSVATDDPLRIIPAISGSSDNVTGVGLMSTAGAGGEYTFDGANDFVNVPYNAALAPIAAITLSAWIKTTKSGEQILVSRAIQSGGYNGYLLAMDTSSCAGSGDISFWVGSGYFCSTSSGFNDGNWHHVLGTYNGTTATIYVDGVQVGTGAAGNGLAEYTTQLTIGSWQGLSFVQGDMKNVRVYSSHFDSTEAAALFAAENTNSGFTKSGLVGYWKLDEHTGQTVYDSSGNDLNGTLGANSSVATDDPVQSAPTATSTLWVATNGAGANDGAVTSISGVAQLQNKVFTTTNSDLPDADITSITMGRGGIAFIGTEAGAWSTGAAGSPEVASGSRSQPTRVQAGTRLTGGVRLGR